MVVHKKNLLDAFRRAAPEGRQAPPEVSRSANPAGPFAHAKRKESEEPAEASEAEFTLDRGERPEDDRRSALARLVTDPGFRLVVLVAALIGVGAWVAGRFGSKSAQASDRAPAIAADGAAQGVLASGAAGEDAVEKNRAAARMGSPADAAFMNLENKFTVRLAQYNNDEAGRRKAFETAEFLRKLAIPVASPIEKGKVVILAAGAKPSTGDLDGLLKVVRAQHGTGGQEKQLPFASAYIENIDALVKRR
jgi:hypothetical protein